jgi:N-acetylmuramoyl-L-alanine amidase
VKGSPLDIEQVKSPNFGPRKHGLAPDMVVIHYTAMDTAEAACERLCDEGAEVSAHYLISETGQIIQLVSEDMRAWHAGAGTWGAVSDVNSHSIGIELANATDREGIPFPNPQMDALEYVLSGVLERWSIPIERAIGHSDMAPDRKFDPGPKFDWKRLAIEGLSVWPTDVDEMDADWAQFKVAAEQFGYRAPSDDAKGWQHVLASFRLRFLPSVSGDLRSVDCSVIRALARDYPCKDVDLGQPSV